MSHHNGNPARTGASRTWLVGLAPEDAASGRATGKRLAWRTLAITTANLIMAFIVWFVVSALVVRLPAVGFKLTTTQLFWLAAMPGLAGGTLRIIHTFLVPLYGTRHVVTISTLSLLIPAVGWFYAVQDPTTPYWVLMLLAFLAGLGGGNFSSFMPSTSLFFPKRLQGTALAIQAGIGNFGVSVVQFVTPWIIGFALAGSLLGDPQTFTAAERRDRSDLAAERDRDLRAVHRRLRHRRLGDAAEACRCAPISASSSTSSSEKHGFNMTLLYIMTFGSFSGLSATFPLLIKQIYGPLPGAPDPLTYAFLGPLVGSIARIVAGPVSDRLGGARVTHWSGIGMLVSRDRGDLLHRADVDGRSSRISSRRCSRCSSSPASATPRPSSRCR